MDDYLREESTKVQPNKLHSMTQVPITLTESEGEGQIFQKNRSKTNKKKQPGHISEVILPTDSIHTLFSQIIVHARFFFFALFSTLIFLIRN